MRPSWRPAVTFESSARPRVVTAAALFDGHDAAIQIVRRILQVLGAEVIHLGHDRSVEEIVSAAVQEDAHAVAVSSYQGGHMEFFKYLVDRLRARGAGQVRVYGGGGGTIAPEEVSELERYGVARIFTPQDGQKLGLSGMVERVLADLDVKTGPELGDALTRVSRDDAQAVGRVISWLEAHVGRADPEATRVRDALRAGVGARSHPLFVLGVTGTGGAGKSSVVDELLLRIGHDLPELEVALLLVDPSKRRSGGALLGDRMRLNALGLSTHTYARSMATRRSHAALSDSVADALHVFAAAGFDLAIVETAGTGQSDSAITDLADASLYVMTPEYGAPSQLEKIDMLELADFIALNKADRRGAEDALRDVRKQWKRNHAQFQAGDEAIPVYATIASRWNDAGMDRLYGRIAARLAQHAGPLSALADVVRPVRVPEVTTALIPAARVRYLSEIAEALRQYRAETRRMAEHAADAQGIARALSALGCVAPEPAREYPADQDTEADATTVRLRRLHAAALAELGPDACRALADWPACVASYSAPTQSQEVRGREQVMQNHVVTLAKTQLPRVALPASESWADLLTFLRSENLPGHFPFTAGVFPWNQGDEDPTRMFAGEGTPERTNKRFHLLAAGRSSVRLSTAFDSVTLYGRDPELRPDVYGKVGNSGVSVCTLDDVKKLYSGFDLCAPATSVSMTINGPAPIVLAQFFNAAIDQQIEKHLRATGGLEAVRAAHAASTQQRYVGELPHGHDGLGLGLLGISGRDAVDADTYERIAKDTLARVRGTVQADILKEDQAQNTCIFSTEFALRMMGDVQQYFIAHGIKSFYSVSVSGYHIAEAGANPITQLAFTLANAFTYVEHYVSRGMTIDEIAPSFSFFFSLGLDAEYNVLGRVARRIWAIAMRDRYGANERSQKLKYHIQTSGRSLHAQEMAWNDVRTTLQAFAALADRCNSLHTNAFDEAVTTPTERSVRGALAIQLILTRELGLLKNENPLQGSYVIERLTDTVEDAVLAELDRLSERGGVLGSMETLYQRGKIQDESLEYETRKHSGELPIVGVNTFVDEHAPQPSAAVADTVRASEHEKCAQLTALREFQARNAEHGEAALRRLLQTASRGGNVFDELMRTVRHASLGQISDALFQVGGRYRRSM